MNFDLGARARKVAGAKPEKNAQKDEEAPKYQSTHYTDAERDQLLLGYVEVPEDAWTLLRPHTHIRYLTKSGLFRRGGFVHNVKTKGKAQIFVETGLVPGAPGYAKWPVTLEDVDKIWKKRTVEDVQMAESASTGIDEMAERRIDALEAITEKQSREIKKLIEIMGKLNEKVVKLARGATGGSPLALTPRGAGLPAAGVAARR
jgi:hypothetical protein